MGRQKKPVDPVWRQINGLGVDWIGIPVSLPDVSGANGVVIWATPLAFVRQSAVYDSVIANA